MDNTTWSLFWNQGRWKNASWPTEGWGEEWQSHWRACPGEAWVWIDMRVDNLTLLVNIHLPFFGHAMHGLWVLSSPTTDWTGTLCIGCPSLNHWTAREVLALRILKWFYLVWKGILTHVCQKIQGVSGFGSTCCFSVVMSCLESEVQDGGDICIPMVDSWWFMAETNTIL